MLETLHTLMRRQAGVIGRRQALDAGLTERQIDHRVRTACWTRLIAGVYLSADTELTWHARAHAAILAADPAATLVAESAAAIRELSPRCTPLTVAVPPDRHRAIKLPWVKVLRLHVPEADRVVVAGVSTTTRLRTAVDLAHLVPSAQAQPIIDRMLVLDQVDLAELTAAVNASRRHGSRQARALMRSANDLAAADSERLARRLLRVAGLTGWVGNHRVTLRGRPRKLDLANHRLRIGIEVKGWMFHSAGDRAASDDDRVVDMQLSDWIVIPVGWLTLHAEPEKFLAQVRAAVAFRERGSAA
jgi:hypothetical protein